MFDVCNVKSPFAKGFKAPLTLNNRHQWQPFLERAYGYLMNLRDKDGVPLTYSRRKTTVIGFMVNIRSVIGMFSDLCDGPSPRLR